MTLEMANLSVSSANWTHTPSEHKYISHICTKHGRITSC